MKLTHKYQEALDFANEAHRCQYRKGTDIPYLSHLIQVSGLVIEYGGDEDQAIAALLHDAVEDKHTTIDVIRERFGDQVAHIVAGCTDTATGLGEEKEDWYERKKAYIARFRHEPGSIRLVSAADKLHNARAILRDFREMGDSLFDRFNADKASTLWYYHSLIDAFRETGTNPVLVDDLARTVGEFATLAYSTNTRTSSAETAP